MRSHYTKALHKTYWNYRVIIKIKQEKYEPQTKCSIYWIISMESCLSTSGISVKWWKKGRPWTQPLFSFPSCCFILVIVFCTSSFDKCKGSCRAKRTASPCGKEKQNQNPNSFKVPLFSTLSQNYQKPRIKHSLFKGYPFLLLNSPNLRNLNITLNRSYWSIHDISTMEVCTISPLVMYALF